MSEEILDNTIIEPIIFKLACTDAKYANFIHEYYTPGLFEDSVLGDVMDKMVNKFYIPKNALPSIDTINLVTTKMFKDDIKASLRVESSLAADIDVYDREYIDENIIEYMKHIAVFDVITNSVSDLSEGVTDFKHTDRLTKLSNMSFFDDLGCDYVQTIDQHIIDLLEPSLKQTTYWPQLDKLTDGGYFRTGKNLVVYMAPAGMGKSLFLSNTAANALKDGKFVVIISLEMSEFIYSKRIDAHLSKTSIDDLKNNTTAIKSAVQALPSEGKLVIKEYPPDSTNCAQVKNYIDSLIRLHGRKPDMILIDYINLMSPSKSLGKSANSYTKVDIISKEMRGMSYHFECPLITCTQTNRSGISNDVPALDNISDSMGIAFTADFIGAIFQNELDRDDGLLNMVILKNRLGGHVGKVLQFDTDYETLLVTDHNAIGGNGHLPATGTVKTGPKLDPNEVGIDFDDDPDDDSLGDL